MKLKGLEFIDTHKGQTDIGGRTSIFIFIQKMGSRVTYFTIPKIGSEVSELYLQNSFNNVCHKFFERI